MAITSFNGGSAIDAAPRKMTLSSNYVDFTSSDTEGWAQQYLPDLMEKEAEIYGNRTISGFLAQVGAEEASTSDRVVWSEQGRLHLAYQGTIAGSPAGDASDGIITITKDIDGNTVDGSAGNVHGIRVGDIVLVSQSNATVRGYVDAADATTITVHPYNEADLDAAGLADDSTASAVRILVVGSEFAKGTDGRTAGNEPKFKSYMNKHIILKDFYEVSGSDASAIGWVEVSGEEGQSGYLWYLKAEGDTRARFSDYIEMSMLEGELTVANSVIDLQTGTDTGADGSGTQGLFDVIVKRGHQSTGITGVNAATDLAEFDAMLAVFDQNGAIEENMMFVDRSTSLAIDDMLASMNSYGSGGTSYGVFNNEEDMALNLGFSGFRRGSYDFYKSDFKYLNDKGARGALNDTVNNIRGVVIPAGVSSVYDQSLGKNMKTLIKYVRYRASQTESRKYKTWVTGSVGAKTSGKDVMEVHYLSERCLITQGANNFMLLN